MKLRLKELNEVGSHLNNEWTKPLYLYRDCSSFTLHVTFNNC